MALPHSASLTLVALLPLIGWAVYRRVRRMLGRQRLSRVRPWITLVAFPVLLGLLAMTAFVPPHPQPGRLVWLVGALLAGGGIAVAGLKRTRFEATDEGLFYTPDARIGIAISALIVLRVVYRMGRLLIVGIDPSEGTEAALNPWTLVPVGIFCGYYMAYAAGLVRARWRMLRAQSQGGPRP
jgi:hypothetical protein